MSPTPSGTQAPTRVVGFLLGIAVVLGLCVVGWATFDKATVQRWRHSLFPQPPPTMCGGKPQVSEGSSVDKVSTDFNLPKPAENSPSTWRDLAAVEPVDLDGCWKQGKIYFEIGSWRDAERVFSSVIRLAPADDARFAEAILLRGRARANLDQWSEAAGDFNRAIELGLDPSIRLERARARALSKDHDGALTDVAEFLSVDPNDPEALCWKGAALAGKQDFEGAREALSRSIELNPTPTRFFQRAEMYREWRNHAEAIADYARALEINGRWFLPRSRILDELAATGRPVEMEPWIVGGAYGVAEAKALFATLREFYGQREDIDGWTSALDRLTSQLPGCSVAWLEHGKAMRYRGDRERALADLARARELDPDNSIDVSEVQRQIQMDAMYEDLRKSGERADAAPQAGS